MGWYPCCCAGKNSLYVPCCLYGIAFNLKAYSPSIQGICYIKHLYLQNMAGDVSADHGTVTKYWDSDFQDFQFGSLYWYQWGLPISLENLYEPQPNGNWKVRFQIKNIDIHPAQFKVKDCTLSFSFWVPLGTGHMQTVTLNPVSVGGGWTDEVNLVGNVGEAYCDIPAEGLSSELELTYDAIPIAEVKTTVHTSRSFFYSFTFPSTEDASTARHCMEFFKATSDAPRDNTSPVLTINCNTDGDAYGDWDCVSCSCLASRPDSPETCSSCRCVSNTPIKLGGFGPTAPEPSIVDITGFAGGKAESEEWTVYGWAKDLGPGLNSRSTLIWTGRDSVAANNAPQTVVSFKRVIQVGFPTAWRLSIPGFNGILDYVEGAEPPDYEGNWFFWWLVKKKDGGNKKYKFGMITTAGGAVISDWLSNVSDVGWDGFTVLGDDGEFSFLPTSVRLDESFFGCVDGLTFVDYAAEDIEMQTKASAGCTVPTPPPFDDMLAGNVILLPGGKSIVYQSDGESTFYLP